MPSRFASATKALPLSLRAASEATWNEYGAPYCLPEASTLPPCWPVASSMNGDQVSQASTLPEVNAASASAGGRLSTVTCFLVRPAAASTVSRW